MKKFFTKLFSGRSVPKSDSPIPMPGNASVTKRKKRKNPVGLIVALFFVVGGILVGQYLLNSQGNNQPVKGTSTKNTSKKSQKVELDNSFSFRAYDKSKKLSKKEVTYTVTGAEKTDQIILKGKRATAVEGREFLIISLKIDNKHDESLFLNTRNYIRVQPDGSSDKLAPEIHNDTVEVQPGSTKITRVGMPIDENDNKFKIFIGEVDEDKKEIEISF